ncbi:hypothetical protein GCM10008107_09440 [Psychrosphaera saromensis]|uniref:Cellulose biosynthesis protein BcsE n=2 Tax=Psychrosphaera saromensis TaxID=716813 RepID=A0A2S7UUU7_9GAMM|nr:hypothetical protein BTO11_08885 [Psychrosphaera saromensis]GHB62474.1 hypothetical protein GCM10008107_09440 [Psychrosphaera saromensis]GLQ15447.1 hypothetical protein GCM10007917_29020 [Psychrosphaera saromensis]
MNKFMTSKLNITGLPPLINTLEHGKLYCITVQSARWFDTLMSHVVSKRNTLLSFRDIEDDYPRVADRFKDKKIDIITIEQKRLQKLSKKLTRFLIELSQLQIKDGALYIDLSDLLLSEQAKNEQLVIELKRFASRQNLAIVLLFNEGDKDSDVEQFLSHQRTDFYGIMKFSGGVEPSSLQIDIWYIDTGCVVNQNYRVQNLNGQLALSISDNVDLAVSQFQQADVIVDQHYKELGPKLNKSWTIAKNHDDLFRLIKENPSATVLMHALKSTSLKELAQQIYKLRQLAGQNLKVIILEVNINLRMTEQSILRCLGANLILPSKIHINTLTNIISSTANLVFVGDLTADFYSVYDEESMPTKLGYLTPNGFTNELQKLTASSVKYGISSTLVILEIPSGIAAMDTIKYAQFNRNGDIFTVVDNAIYVYLYGCRDADVDSTLTFILGAEPLLIFRSAQRYVKSDAIKLQTIHLSEYIQRNPVVDYLDRITEFAEHREKMENMRADTMDAFEINIAIPAQLKLKNNEL